MAAVAAAHHGMAAARIGTVDTLLVGAGDGRRMAVRDALAGALAGRPPSYTVAIQPAAVRARGAHAGGRRDPHPLRRALWTPGLPRTWAWRDPARGITPSAGSSTALRRRCRT